jgi:hypothetical protein
VRRTSPTIAIASVLAGAVFASGIARADDAPATGPGDDQRPNAALAACASGDVAKGISILGQLYAETRNPSYVFNQGRCFQKNNKLTEARGSFTEYLRIGTNEPPEDIQRAQGFIKEIDETLARERASQPAPLLVTPVQPGGDGRAHALRTTSIVLAAVGVAAVGAGVFLSFKVKSINDSINNQYANQAFVTDEAQLEKQISDGKSYETWQWVAYGLGVAALAGAVTTFVLSGHFAGAPGTGPETPAVTVTPTASSDGVGGVVRVRF